MNYIRNRINRGRAKHAAERCDEGSKLLGSNNYDEAESNYGVALSARTQVFGRGHHAVAEPLTGLAMVRSRRDKDHAAALPLFEEALRLRESMPKAPAASAEADRRRDKLVARSLNNLAACLTALGHHDRAKEALERAALLLGEGQLNGADDVATVMHTLSTVYFEQAQHDKALDLNRAALRITEQSPLRGENHPDSCTTLYNIGMIAQYRHGPADAAGAAEACEVYARVHRRLGSWFGSEERAAHHPTMCESQISMSVALETLGDLESAAQMREKGLRGLKIRFRMPGHDRVHAETRALVALLRKLGKNEDADTLERELAADI